MDTPKGPKWRSDRPTCSIEGSAPRMAGLLPHEDRVMWSNHKFHQNVSLRLKGKLGACFKELAIPGDFSSPSDCQQSRHQQKVVIAKKGPKCQIDFQKMNGPLRESWPYRLLRFSHWRCKYKFLRGRINSTQSKPIQSQVPCHAVPTETFFNPYQLHPNTMANMGHANRDRSTNLIHSTNRHSNCDIRLFLRRRSSPRCHLLQEQYPASSNLH